jgi:REP element-mobilizing transposase RayT
LGDTYTKLRYHVVFATKHRSPLITPDIRDPLYRHLGGILIREGGTLLAIGGMPDHIHLLIGLGTTHTLADVMQKLKASTSRRLNQRSLLPEPFAWQVGYGAFSVSESQIGVVQSYILRQEEHHRKISFEDELRQILHKHGFEADSKFLAG